MSASCCGSLEASRVAVDPRFRAALWVALVINVAMFAVEIVGGIAANSVSLWADAVDFAGDAANYAVSLAALSLGFTMRSRIALLKGITMTGFGVVVLASAGWAAVRGLPPEPLTMGAIGFVALLANAAVAGMLFAFRDGDANMRSVWLCSRNDVIGNLAVIVAAAGVLGSGSGIPDIIVASIMATLALTSGTAVIRQARRELHDQGVTRFFPKVLADDQS